MGTEPAVLASLSVLGRMRRAQRLSDVMKTWLAPPAAPSRRLFREAGLICRGLFWRVLSERHPCLSPPNLMISRGVERSRIFFVSSAQSTCRQLSSLCPPVEMRFISRSSTRPSRPLSRLPPALSAAGRCRLATLTTDVRAARESSAPAPSYRSVRNFSKRARQRFRPSIRFDTRRRRFTPGCGLPAIADRADARIQRPVMEQNRVPRSRWPCWVPERTCGG